MNRLDRTILAAEKVECGEMSLNIASHAYDVTPKEITKEIARIEADDQKFIADMSDKL